LTYDGIQPLSAGDCYVIPNSGEFNLSHCSADLKVLEVREENKLTPNPSFEREENKRGEL
jgi:mannose-6-phosphate isomerase-like protein (cupin superfamily)